VPLELKDSGNKNKVGFLYAWNGLVTLIKTEKNFQIHLTVSIFVIIINVILQLSVIEWTIILLTIGSVLITEAFNTTVELTIDYVKPEFHPQAKIIKDIAAGAVLLAASISVIIGIIIYIPKILALL